MLKLNLSFQPVLPCKAMYKIKCDLKLIRFYVEKKTLITKQVQVFYSTRGNI